MSVCVILPTADIVRTYRDFEPLFCFREDGIKGLVRDAIFLGSGFIDAEITSQEEIPFAQGLLEKIVQEYETSLDLRYLENTYPNAAPAHAIEMVVSQIDYAVRSMMLPFFRFMVYEVLKSQYQWLGDDLLTYMNVFEQHHGFGNRSTRLHVRRDFSSYGDSRLSPRDTRF